MPVSARMDFFTIDGINKKSPAMRDFYIWKANAYLLLSLIFAFLPVSSLK
jgi:hypothetical protein